MLDLTNAGNQTNKDIKKNLIIAKDTPNKEAIKTSQVKFVRLFSIQKLILPFIDFRAYKVGNYIPDLMEPSEELKYSYIMEKDGRSYEFETYPNDESYIFKEIKRCGRNGTLFWILFQPISVTLFK